MQSLNIPFICWLCRLMMWVLFSTKVTRAFESYNLACWSNEQECVIHATLRRPADPVDSTGLPMDINCFANLELGESAVQHKTNVYQERYYEGLLHVTLDGCHTPLRTRSYGYEFLLNCDKITKAEVKRFHADIVQQFYCPKFGGSSIQLEIVRFFSNEIGAIVSNSFQNLHNVREVYFKKNSLRYIDHTAFDLLRVVKSIHIEVEPLLVLNDEGDHFERSTVVNLHLIKLKQLTSKLFQHLPKTLNYIYVEETHIDTATVQVINTQMLHNISITGCALKSFDLIDRPSSVLFLNLSGNSIAYFHVSDGNLTSNGSSCALQTLDLSANRLEHLNTNWLNNLGNLRRIILQENLLKTVSVRKLVVLLPKINLIDLRDNNLVALLELSSTEMDFGRIRLKIDRNPWNCIWLLDFAHAHPEKFRIFHYEKFISRINVNGLECKPEEGVFVSETKNIEAIKQVSHSSVKSKINNLNVSTHTLIYGDPWNTKRNNRASALILVFLLPVGIASLFVFLYLWIKCQRIFHLSYYRSFPPGRNLPTSPTAINRSAEILNVIEQLSPSGATFLNMVTNNGEGYETPLNGRVTTYNCNNVACCPSSGSDKYSKIHITYESLPTEHASKIYEEISEELNKQEFMVDDVRKNSAFRPFYDHLVFHPSTSSNTTS